MPHTRVIFFQGDDHKAPVLEWLRDLRDQNESAWLNCQARLKLLNQSGHELRRPAADYLRDGIYELRARRGHVQYRILYFFHGRNVAILAHSLSKEDAIPSVDIERALKRKQEFENNPERHTYAEDWQENP